jgi:uncharacterized membrane protein YcaP (DUF421 family)
VIHRIFDAPSLSGAAIIAAKTAVIYLFLIVGLRVLGKRELGQLSLYDLVMIIVLGNAVQNAMINGDNTLLGGVIAAIVLLVLNRLLHELTVRYRPAERLLVGEPALLVHDGQILDGHMRREGITRDQLDAALREHGFSDLSEARAVVLEVDGTMSVVSRSGTMHRTRKHYRGLRLP